MALNRMDEVNHKLTTPKGFLLFVCLISKNCFVQARMLQNQNLSSGLSIGADSLNPHSGMNIRKPYW
jgi:hypothetical protein